MKDTLEEEKHLYPLNDIIIHVAPKMSFIKNRGPWKPVRFKKMLEKYKISRKKLFLHKSNLYVKSYIFGVLQFRVLNIFNKI